MRKFTIKNADKLVGKLSWVQKNLTGTLDGDGTVKFDAPLIDDEPAALWQAANAAGAVQFAAKDKFVSTMRRFQLNRSIDVSGVSGTGIVAEGVQFTDGRVVINWLTTYRSVVIWESINDVIAVHGHDGNTVIDWLDKS